MADWTLVACLTALRAEFNKLAPNRDKASDGSIGDDEHAGSSSDHNPDETGTTPYEDADSKNEVHAIDVDKDLNEPGVTMEDCVRLIVDQHRRGKDTRLQNVIYNRRIWSKSWGWTERPYTGSNPHNKHAHFSARYTDGAEAGTQPYGLMALKQEDFPVDQTTFNKLMTGWARSGEGKQAIAQAVLTYDPGVTSEGKVVAGGVENITDDEAQRKANPTVSVAWALGNRTQLAVKLAYELRERLDALAAKIEPVADPAPATTAKSTTAAAKK